MPSAYDDDAGDGGGGGGGGDDDEYYYDNDFDYDNKGDASKDDRFIQQKTFVTL